MGQVLEKIWAVFGENFLAVFGEIRAVFNFGLVLEDICAVFEELWGSLGKTFGQF